MYYGLVDIINKKSQQLKINSLFLQIHQFNGTEFESNNRLSDIPLEGIALRFHVVKHFNKVCYLSHCYPCTCLALGDERVDPVAQFIIDQLPPQLFFDDTAVEADSVL